MSLINTVPGIDNAKLTLVARSLIKNADDLDNTQLIKAFTVVVDGTPPKVVTLSFDELEGMMNILDLGRPIKARLEPSQWTILTYQLDDLDKLLGEGYRITEYILALNAKTNVLSFSGVIKHITTIPEHGDYDPESTLTPKEFEFALGDFEVIQQIAISRVMAGWDTNFEPVAGTFDVSWTYSFSPNGVTFTTEGPDEE